MNFLEIGNALVTSAYKVAQLFHVGAFKFRLEKACPCSDKDYVPYCEGGTLQVEPGWFRCLDALHLEYAETGLEVFKPHRFHLFLLCEAGKTAGQQMFDEIYDRLIEILQKEEDQPEPAQSPLAVAMAASNQKGFPPVVEAAFVCFVGAASSLDKKEE